MTISGQFAALLACAAVATGVYAVMIGSIVAFRRTAVRAGPHPQSMLVEILWSLVPITIMVGLVLPAAALVARQ